MKFGLSEKTILEIQKIFAQTPEIDEVIIYGSRAKGNFKPGSDIDLALKGKLLNLKIINRVSNAIDELLLPYTGDLCIFHQIENQDLVEHIERVGKSFYSKTPS